MLATEIPVIVSNHPDCRETAERYGVEYHHLPIEPGATGDRSKAAQEARVRELVDRHDIDLVVLARYMQILSPELCAATVKLEDRSTSTTHSCPGLSRCAKPLSPGAFARGVKIIGRNSALT